MWGEMEISQDDVVWLLPDPCTRVPSCQADLVPESWRLACGAGLVATWSDPDVSSASLPCVFMAPIP